MAHSFYVLMGGLLVHDDLLPDRYNQFFPHRTPEPRTEGKLSFKGFHFLIQRYYADIDEFIPPISEAEIRDKSKSNALVKTLLVVQASWFIVECIFRLSTGYSISLLELNTLGHCISAVFIYLMWWSKPFDITEPTPLNSGSIVEQIAWMVMNSRFTPVQPFSELKCLNYQGNTASSSVETEEREGWVVEEGRYLYGYWPKAKPPVITAARCAGLWAGAILHAN